MVNKSVDVWYKFYQNLELYYSISRTQFKEYNFIFIGEFNPHADDEDNSIINEGENLLPNHISYLTKSPCDYVSKDIIYKLENRFIYKTECICEVKIMKNCFIYSKSKDLLLNIGSECCDKFNENKNINHVKCVVLFIIIVKIIFVMNVDPIYI